MKHGILTVGYSGWTRDAFAQLVRDRQALVVDIRYQPHSQMAEWDARALRQQFGSSYMHMLPLGNVNYRGDGPIQLAAPEAAVAPVARLLQRGDVILLCGCANVERCHRKTAAAFLAERLQVSVEHVEPPVARPARGAAKAFTIAQPWATLLAAGALAHVARSWPTSYRGPIAIHAAKSTPRLEDLPSEQLRACGVRSRADLPVGQVIGAATLIDCCAVVQQQAALGYLQRGLLVPLPAAAQTAPLDPGSWLWLFSDARAFAHGYAARGSAGLWDWPVPPEQLDALEVGA